METIMYKLYSTVALTVVALSVHAQGRRMAIVDMPVSAVSLAHGGGVFGFSERALVYADPSVGFDDTQTTMCANYAFGLVDGAGGSMGLHTLGLSHRSGKHLLMGGARYFAQGKTGPVLDINMKPVADAMRLYSYGVDVGYVHTMGRFAIYGILGMISEKTDVQDNAYRLGIGMAFHGQKGLMRYKLNLAVRDLGGVGTGDRWQILSPLLHGGGALRLATARNQELDVTLDSGVYLPSGKSKVSGMLSGGVDYTLAKRYSLRLGGHAGDHDDYLGAGLGVRVGRIAFDAAVRLTAKDGASHLYMAGVQVDL